MASCLAETVPGTEGQCLLHVVAKGASPHQCGVCLEWGPPRVTLLAAPATELLQGAWPEPPVHFWQLRLRWILPVVSPMPHTLLLGQV